VVLVLFALLPARRAVVAALIAAWLLLPPVGLDLPGLPAYDKTAAATIGIVLATAMTRARHQPHSPTNPRQLVNSIHLLHRLSARKEVTHSTV
jgi:hypothetical protein